MSGYHHRQLPSLTNRSQAHHLLVPLPHLGAHGGIGGGPDSLPRFVVDRHLGTGHDRCWGQRRERLRVPPACVDIACGHHREQLIFASLLLLGHETVKAALKGQIDQQGGQ